MLGGATWPIRAAAVLVAAGVTALGVYFVAQANEDDAPTSEPTPTASAAQTPAATATSTSPPATATPTNAPPSPPVGMLSESETADWTTYESPFGFTVRYPPNWSVNEEPAYPDRPMEGFFGVDFVNPTLAEFKEQLPMGVGYVPPPGAVEINFFVSKNMPIESPFDPEVLSDFCETSVIGEHNAIRLHVQGHRAVGCEGSEILPYGMLWIELPENRTLRVMMDVAEAASDSDILITRTIYSSLDLTDS